MNGDGFQKLTRDGHELGRSFLSEAKSRFLRGLRSNNPARGGVEMNSTLREHNMYYPPKGQRRRA
ncbi:MAG: hypothetical protein AMJ89_03875 [candidate division Zixibacteria bacterium SM23_73]|nr:MAG: hypothetical protein AMJ89_03875 [candidate division Zixibacteria bacterium SM23_73]